MRRREFITLLGGAAALAWWPVVGRAQQSAHVPVIGFLGFGPASGTAPWAEALRQGLRDLGFIEGTSFGRSASNASQMVCSDSSG
jgi:putative ABC transport system substrate-binding protein